MQYLNQLAIVLVVVDLPNVKVCVEACYSAFLYKTELYLKRQIIIKNITFQQLTELKPDIFLNEIVCAFPINVPQMCH